MTLTVTFALGTDVDKAQVQVQNRVAQALPKLPDVVQRLGVIDQEGLARSDDGRAPGLAGQSLRHTLSRRTTRCLRVKDELARLDGVGDVQVFGAGNYSMRVWLDPEKVASRGLTAGDVVRAHPRAERAGGRRTARRAVLCASAGTGGQTSRSRSTPRAA